MQLARDLGMLKNELLLRITSREITEWIAFYSMLNEKEPKIEKPNPMLLQEKFKALMDGKITKVKK